MERDPKVPVWQEPLFVRTFDVGPDNRADPPALGRYLQEAASRQAASLGFGYDNLDEHKLFWVLTRLAVEVYRYPQWNEELLLHTWPAGLARPYALRSFRMYDSTGAVVLEAGSAWMTIEYDTRRPRRIETVIDTNRYDGAEQVLAGQLVRIRPPETEHAITPEVQQADAPRLAWHEARSVRLSDLDGQKHTNNMTYLEWILDSCADHPDFDTSTPRHELTRFRMNFLKETHHRDRLMLWSVPRSEFSTKDPATESTGITSAHKAQVAVARIPEDQAVCDQETVVTAELEFGLRRGD